MLPPRASPRLSPGQGAVDREQGSERGVHAGSLPSWVGSLCHGDTSVGHWWITLGCGLINFRASAYMLNTENELLKQRQPRLLRGNAAFGSAV